MFPVAHRPEFPLKQGRRSNSYLVDGTEKTFAQTTRKSDLDRLAVLLGIYQDKRVAGEERDAIKDYIKDYGLRYRFEDSKVIQSRFPGRYIDIQGPTVWLRLICAIDNSQFYGVAVKMVEATDGQLFQFCAYFGWDLYQYTRDVAEKMIMKAVWNASSYDFAGFSKVDPVTAMNPCCFPNCGRECFAHTPCCQDATHMRYAYFNVKKAGYERSGDLFGATLAEVFRGEFTGANNGNKLQPRVHSLRLMIPLLAQRFANCWELLQRFLPYVELFECFIAHSRSIDFLANGDVMIRRDDEKVLNQVARASAIARSLVDRHEHLLIMDGHGFVVLNVLRELQSPSTNHRLLKRIRLHWVDNVGAVNNWHATMFPCDNITYYAEDVFTVARRLLTNSTIDPNSLLPYFNFCGISESWPVFMSFLMDETIPIPRHFLSFSIARKANVMASTVQTWLKANGIDFRLVTDAHVQRGDFVTFVLGGRQRAATATIGGSLPSAALRNAPSTVSPGAASVPNVVLPAANSTAGIAPVMRSYQYSAQSA